MAALTYDIRYDEARSRLTNAFRMILAIPHIIVMSVWGYFAEILGFVQWFIILFTGKRNRGLWDLQRSWLGYAGSVNGYTNLMFDPYPAFGPDPGPAPVALELDYEEPASRLTNGLRFLWAIPALIIATLLGIALGVVVIISWFAIVITGKHPKGMFDFSLKVLRYSLQFTAYILLMTDTYPKWDTGDPAMAAGRGYGTTPAPGGFDAPTPAGPPPGSPLPPPGT